MKTDALGLNLISLSTFSAIWNFKGRKATEKLAFEFWTHLVDYFWTERDKKFKFWEFINLKSLGKTHFGFEGKHFWIQNLIKILDIKKVEINAPKCMKNHANHFFEWLLTVWQNLNLS